MTQAGEYIELVRQAQFGDRDCLGRLAEIATDRLRTHVYRLTLRHDVTQDIVQESILEMMKVLGKLKRPDRFWPWLYGIALNKLRHYWRDEKRHNTRQEQAVGFGGAQEDKQEALEKLLADELRQAVSKAMAAVKPRHRAVLSMRCYDEMPYSQIASVLGCSEFGAQMLFCRAKKSLTRQLARNGLSKGSVAMALVIFGKMTASSEAAAAGISVSAGALKVGIGATVAAAAVGKTVIATVAGAAVVTAGAVMMSPGDNRPAVPADGSGHRIKSVLETPGQTGAPSGECWYFLPDGPQGPVMRRQMRTSDDSAATYCAVLENERGNYYYDRGSDTVFIRNRHFSAENLAVGRLPTDSEKLGLLLGQLGASGEQTGSLEYLPAKGKGILVIASQTGGELTGISRIDRHDNMLEEEYFQFAWPADTKIVDQRDEMHRRGWTYCRIEGRIGSEPVYGKGRIPFVYEQVRDNSAWLRLDIGSSVRVDTASGAYGSNPQDPDKQYYQPGSFMQGLSRPWMGLHTIDSVRRDGAACGMRFDARLTDGGQKARVTLYNDEGGLLYLIDMRRDLVDEIEISTSSVRGKLIFTYINNVDKEEDGFVEPRIPATGVMTAGACGADWLLHLTK